MLKKISQFHKNIKEHNSFEVLNININKKSSLENNF